MNRYCSQCATQLKGNIKICPKCGHKNSTPKGNKKYLIICLIITVIALLLSMVWTFKEKITYLLTHYNDVIAQLNDIDFETKKSYKITHEKYLMDLYWFESSRGFNINPDNAKDFDTVNYSLDGATTQTSAELISKKLNLLDSIEEKGCYNLFNVDKNCDSLRSEVLDLNWNLSVKILTKSTEARFCGNTSYSHFVSTCENSITWSVNHNIYTTCQNCDEKISELIKISSQIKDPDLSQALLEYTMLLKKYNEISSEIIEKHKENLEWTNAIGENKNDLRIVTNGSVTKLISYYKQDSFGSFKVDMLKNTCPTLSKRCIINDLNGNINRIVEQSLLVDDELTKLQDNAGVLNDQIKTLANIINGKSGLNLSVI